MEHQHSPEPRPTFVPNPPAEQKHRQTAFDAYLDRICLPLARTLSADEITVHRAEMLDHLEALYAAHLELGCSEAEALRLTQEQFGKENQLHNAWQTECEAALLNAETPHFRVGYRLAVRRFCFAFLFSSIFGGGMMLLPLNAAAPQHLLISWFCFDLTILSLCPFLAGVHVGRRVRYRPVLTSLLATLTTCLMIPTLYLTMLYALYSRFPGTPHIDWLSAWLRLDCFIIAVMSPIAMTGAGLGHWSRRFGRRKIASNR